MDNRTAPRAERQAVWLYVLIANAWTWLLWVPALLSANRQGWLLPSPNNYAPLAAQGFINSQHSTLALVFSLAVYGPLLGALAATVFEQGWSGARALLRQVANLRVAPKWLLAALAIAAAMAYVPVLLAWLTGSLAQPVLGFGQRLLWFVPLLLLQLLTSGLGEEPGWRGYLLPRLQKRFDPERAVWLTGLLWALWHYPLTAIYTLQSVPAGAPPAAAGLSVVVSLIGQTMGVIGLTYIYAWLFKHTRSIFLMIFFHALTNILPFLAPLALGPWALLAGVFPWVIVLALGRLAGKDFLRSGAAA